MNKLLITLLGLTVTFVTAATAMAQEVKGDAKAGATKNAMCVGCHGIPGYQATFPEVYKVPMISGQGAGYISSALNAYKKGERRHPTMGGVAKSLTDQDIADLAAYYSAHGAVEGASLPAKPGKEPTAPVAELLKKANCVSCHGENFAKPLDPADPKLAGQHADYLFAALKAYKVENNPVSGRANAIMGSMAKQFSNNELKAMASYLATLDGGLKVVPESRFR